jgi:hypothetical protein
MFYKVSGWLIALLSLIVNYLQYRQNKKLKNQLNFFQKKRISTKNIQQHHSGCGNNINIAGDVEFKK